MKKSRFLAKIVKKMMFYAIAILGTGLHASGSYEPEQDWDRSSVFYQVFVRSFYDGNGDGKGDIPGITAKLDYFQNLGVDALWLTPLHPSPTYHGYDVVDYSIIHPDFGTLEDFSTLVKEAHKRNIKIVIDWVVNHTSSQHQWFKKALAGDPAYKDFYVWSDQGVNGSWGLQANGKYAYFTFGPQSGMPDLNYDNPQVRKEIIALAQLWLSRGVDGFRLDVAQAIGDGNRQKTVDWWKEFQTAVKKTNPKAFIVGEVNFDAPSDFTKIAPFYAGMDTAFNFPIYNALTVFASGYQTDIVSPLNKAMNTFKSYQKNPMDSLLIGNHDRMRIASFLKFDPLKMKKAMSLLFTLPGRPFIYYGDEIGMRGGHDRQGDPFKREPMDWYAAGSGPGQPLMDAVNYTSAPRNLMSQDGISVEEALADSGSLLNYVKTLIHIRKAHPLLFQGKITRLGVPEGLFAYQRTLEGVPYSITVVQNQMASAPRSVPLTEAAEDLVTGRLYKAGDLLEVSNFGTAILKVSSPKVPFAKYDIITPAVPQCTLTIKVQVPENTPADAELWMPNSTDGWQPGEILPNPGTKLKKIGPRLYEITVTREGGSRLEYKFFRGGWETSETEADGNWNGNREFLFLEPVNEELAIIDGWRDLNYKGE